MKKRVFSLFLSFIFMAALIFSFGKPAQAATPPDSRDLIPGIDVSQWQGYINFDQVYRSGIRIVYIRAGEGMAYTDPFFERNYTRARAAGLNVGAYLYVTARNEAQARSQAHFFASLMEGKTFQCRPAMDFEDLSGLSDAQIRAIAGAFLESLEEYTGSRPVIYSDISNARRLDASFASYPWWAAQYDTNEVSDTGIWNSWTGWQYSDAGRISGINGNVDQNRFTPDIYISSPAPGPSPGPALENPRITVDYTIRPGDTLWSIASRFHTTVARIAADNRIQDPNRIYAGEILHIQTQNSRTDHARYLYYTVRPGDTLSAIAARYNTSTARLAALNHITTPDLIYAGQVIKVP